MTATILRLCSIAMVLLCVACGTPDSAGTAATSAPLAPTTLPTALPTIITTANPTSSPAVPTDKPPVATAPANPSVQAGPKAVVVRYHITGGIAGIDDLLTVYNDGTLTLEKRGKMVATTQAAPADVTPLTALLASSEFKGLNSRYGELNACCDRQTFAIEVVGAQTIETSDGASLPAVLEETLKQLNSLYRTARAAAPTSRTVAHGVA